MGAPRGGRETVLIKMSVYFKRAPQRSRAEVREGRGEGGCAGPTDSRHGAIHVGRERVGWWLGGGDGEGGPARTPLVAEGAVGRRPGWPGLGCVVTAGAKATVYGITIASKSKDAYTIYYRNPLGSKATFLPSSSRRVRCHPMEHGNRDGRGGAPRGAGRGSRGSAAPPRPRSLSRDSDSPPTPAVAPFIFTFPLMMSTIAFRT